jgi:hypothetical protein
MRKITREIVRAFENRTSLRISNSKTDGTSLWLFGNKIAEWRHDGLWISNGGWNSRTTKERLNGLRGVRVEQFRGVWFLNENEWNGSWVNVEAWNYGLISLNQNQSEQVANEPEFDVTSEWTEHGYSRPIYSIFHTLNEANLGTVESLLNEQGIPYRRMESDTEGMYRPNYFIVVRPEDVDRAIASYELV